MNELQLKECPMEYRRETNRLATFLEHWRGSIFVVSAFLASQVLIFFVVSCSRVTSPPPTIEGSGADVAELTSIVRALNSGDTNGALRRLNTMLDGKIVQLHLGLQQGATSKQKDMANQTLRRVIAQRRSFPVLYSDDPVSAKVKLAVERILDEAKNDVPSRSKNGSDGRK